MATAGQITVAVIGDRALGVVNEEVKRQIAEHNLTEGFMHTNLVASQCACLTKKVDVRPRVVSDGGVCHHCGGLTVRTGTCHTCQECGASDGCG